MSFLNVSIFIARIVWHHWTITLNGVQYMPLILIRLWFFSTRWSVLIALRLDIVLHVRELAVRERAVCLQSLPRLSYKIWSLSCLAVHKYYRLIVFNSNLYSLVPRISTAQNNLYRQYSIHYILSTTSVKCQKFH